MTDTRVVDLYRALENESIEVGFGDTTAETSEDPNYLLTIWGPEDGRDLWLMSDLGLTPVVWRAYHTSRLATIDLSKIPEAVATILKLLNDEA